MEWKERRLTVSGLELTAKQWGDDDAKPVLALHGWLDNAASFDGLAPLLGDAVQLVALDLPGHGSSQGRGADQAYHFVDWVGVVLESADALGWETFSILGHSMGAAIAALTAPVAPQRIERMVFLDGMGPWSNPPEKVVEQLRKALSQERVLRNSRGRLYDSTDEMVDAMAKSREDVGRERLRPLVERVARRTEDGRWRFGHHRMLQAASRIRLTEEQVCTFLSSIACPVLLVRPEGGWPVDEEVMKGRLDEVEDLQIHRVQGGHHVHLEAPGRLSEAVRKFLTG